VLSDSAAGAPRQALAIATVAKHSKNPFRVTVMIVKTWSEDKKEEI
jgi:hypothetical protein